MAADQHKEDMGDNRFLAQLRVQMTRIIHKYRGRPQALNDIATLLIRLLAMVLAILGRGERIRMDKVLMAAEAQLWEQAARNEALGAELTRGVYSDKKPKKLPPPKEDA